MANGWGGARPGAGRPKGSKNKHNKSEALRAEILERYGPRVFELLDQLFEIATGEGHGDRDRIAAAKEALNRILGTAPATIAVEPGPGAVRAAAALLEAWDAADSAEDGGAS